MLFNLWRLLFLIKFKFKIKKVKEKCRKKGKINMKKDNKF